VRVAASRVYGAWCRRIATQIKTQSPMYPMPWAQPKAVVSPSNPGTSQKKQSAEKIASSIQLARLTHGQSSLS
jgi:hypothetical protein